MYAAADSTVEPHCAGAGAQDSLVEREPDRRSFGDPHQGCSKGDNLRQRTNRAPAARTNRVHSALRQEVASRGEGGDMIEAGETDLTGRVWPVHLKPQEDELLSSWLARLALAHGQTASSFFTRAWPGRYLLARDLDLWNDQTALKLLARKTNTPLARVFPTTLASYEGWL